jgi:hypothetical protein
MQIPFPPFNCPFAYMIEDIACNLHQIALPTVTWNVALPAVGTHNKSTLLTPSRVKVEPPFRSSRELGSI